MSLLGCGSSAEVQFPSINTSWAVGGSIVRQAGQVEVPCERPKSAGDAKNKALHDLLQRDGLCTPDER